MIRYKSLLTLLLFFIILCISGEADAQSARRNFTRPQTYDVEHYVIRVAFDRPATKVIGDTTIRFKPLKDGFTVAEFDAVGIKFDSVTIGSGSAPAKFRTAGGRILVNLDRQYKEGETITLRFKHTAVPRKGVYFIDEVVENGQLIHSEQIWTQGEPEEARHWFPSFDFPSDKATTEQFITAKEGETVIGNGEFVNLVKNADQTVTHHFRMSDPMPTYLVSFVIGKYVRVGDEYRNIPLGFFVYPGAEATARKAFGDTKKMMQVFETVTGVGYPYKKYDQTIVSGFTFGGMENMTATTLADTEIFAVNNPLFTAGVGDLVSHELAHSWFGNLVTCRNWAELWLNEGFATFMEAVYREKAYGRGSYMNKIARDAELFIIDDAVNKKRNALFNQNAGDVSTLFDRPATIYNKGGAVLHTLREELGDEDFWKGVNLYLTRHRFGSVETTDLIKAMEEASERDLSWFFEQWVYMAGHPKLEVRKEWVGSTSTMRLTVSQTHKLDRITPAVFRLPVEVEFTAPDGTKSVEKLNITKRVETFSVKLPAQPSSFTFDPNQKIPVKTVAIHP